MYSSEKKAVPFKLLFGFMSVVAVLLLIPIGTLHTHHHHPFHIHPTRKTFKCKTVDCSFNWSCYRASTSPFMPHAASHSVARQGLFQFCVKGSPKIQMATIATKAIHLRPNTIYV